MNVDWIYTQLLSNCLGGERVVTRNAPCRRLVCPPRMEFTSTPLIGVRRTAWKTALREMEFFMAGCINLKYAHESVRPWWEPFAGEGGDLPYSYGEQFRLYGGESANFDQIAHLIDGLKDHPFSRRQVVTTWHAEQMASGRCNPTNCHGTVIQAFVAGDGGLTLYHYQRSADVVVGLPHNLIQYWALLLWLARRGGRRPARLIYQLGDAHLYEEHAGLTHRILDAADFLQETPQLICTPSSEDFLADDFTIDREYHPTLSETARMVV